MKRKTETCEIGVKDCIYFGGYTKRCHFVGKHIFNDGKSCDKYKPWGMVNCDKHCGECVYIDLCRFDKQTPTQKEKTTRKQYIEMLKAEYRTLINKEIEIGKRKRIIHEQLEKLLDEETLAKMEEKKE